MPWLLENQNRGDSLVKRQTELRKISFYSATAGSAKSADGDAPDSICPYGWHLPAYSGSDSFYNLVQLYLGRTGNMGSLTNPEIPLLLPPLGFLRSGYYDYSNGALGARGTYGGSWSRRSSSATYANLLGFSSADVSAQNVSYRGYGRPVRCLGR